jgi:hypothetical protein
MSNRENKKRRRLERHLRNKAKDENHKKEAWEQGKLIEPNHNGRYYPEEYSLELGKRLLDKPFQLYRGKIRDYLILCNPASRNENWENLKQSYDQWLDQKLQQEL